jgi:hypothetical protein
MSNTLTSPGILQHDTRLLVLAREIAMDIHPLEEIFKRFELTPEDWEALQANHRFQSYLQDAVVSWNAALNASERIKVKGMALIEDWLPDAYGHLASARETLRDKIELFKALQKLTGIGEKTLGSGDASDRVSITINMGADNKLTVEKTFNQSIEAIDISSDPLDVL